MKRVTICLLFLIALSFAAEAPSAAGLKVSPTGRWLSAPTTIKFTSDLVNPSYRYYTSWKSVTPRPTNTAGTLWNGAPITISSNVVVTVIAYNASYFNKFEFQSHTYLFFATTVNGGEFGYKMDLNDEWKAIPAVSITYPQEVPVQSNFAPTVPASIEWIDPADPGNRFFYIGGLKYSGNYNVYLEKKSYRLYFSSKDYGGAGKVREDVFKGFDKWGLLPTKKFENLQFRSGSADSMVWMDWPGRGNGYSYSNGQLIRNQFGDELQLQMGHWSAHSRMVHVFDNGNYFGVFQLRERVDSNYLADYLGNTPDDYEFINHCVLRDGNGTLFAKMEATRGNYEAFKQWVDVKQMCEYMALHFLTLNLDIGTCWNWQGYGPYTGIIDGGFQFYGSDIDMSMLQPTSFTNGGGPANFFGALMSQRHPDFMQIWHDVLYDLFNDGGVLTGANMAATYRYLMQHMEPAFDGEVARWRAYTVDQRYTKDRWTSFANSIMSYWMGGARHAAYFQEMSNNGWMYPGTPPTYSPLKGNLAAGASVTITNRWAGSTVYYTLDGSDPRTPGGGLNPTALSNAGASFAITISKSTTLSSRARTSSGTWTPLQKKNFYVVSQPLVDQKVILSEVVFSAFDSLLDVEFIEFKNTHNQPIDIMGCYLKGDYVRYFFNSTTIIPAGGFLVGTNQRAQFRKIYKKQADFFWSGNLASSADFKLVDAFGNNAISATWDKKDPWPALTTRGYSLVPSPLYDPNVETKQKDGSSWRFSKLKKGSPWVDDGMPVTWTKFDQGNDYLIVNEALLTGDRWVEFKNIKSTPLDISKWVITDNLDKPTKYVIPSGTVVAAGGYWIRTEAQLGFKLNNPALYILNGVNDYEINFPKQLSGMTRGRFTTSDGQVYFAHMASNTQGAANSVAYIPQVVISGFGFGTPKNLYDDYKYVRLTNTGKTPVTMTGWVLSVAGKDFKFKQSGIHFVKLLAGQSIYLIQNSTSVSKFKKVMTKMEETALVFNVIKVSGKDWYDKIELQQPDAKKNDTVTVDQIDISKISVPKKRAVEAENPGPNEITRTTSPVYYYGDAKAWKSTTLTAPLPIDCKWSDWTSWTSCMCDGTQTRDRTMTAEQFGGKPCTNTQSSQTQTCTNLRVCDCSWLAWAEWSACSATCGVGQQTRTRSYVPASNGGAACVGNTSVSIMCTIEECPVDCTWQEWGYWTDCDLKGEACGWGVQARSRGFIPASAGGRPCEMDDQAELLDCNIPCPPVQAPEVVVSNTSEIGNNNEDTGLTVVFAIFLALVVLSLVVAIALAVKALASPSGSSGSGYQAY